MTKSAAESQVTVKVKMPEVLSFETLFDRELAYIWTSLRRLGVADRDVPDVAQELLLEVHNQFSRFDGERPLRPWLFAFAFRFASDYRRSGRVKRESLDVIAERVDGAPSAEETLISEDRRALVLRAIQSIDETRRGVFILSELDNIPMNEIASALNIPTNTAYSRLRLARGEFREALTRLGFKRGTR